jgi:hypothetical protein
MEAAAEVVVGEAVVCDVVGVDVGTDAVCVDVGVDVGVELGSGVVDVVG